MIQRTETFFFLSFFFCSKVKHYSVSKDTNQFISVSLFIYSFVFITCLSPLLFCVWSPGPCHYVVQTHIHWIWVGWSVLPQIISMQLHMQLFITLPLYARLEIKRTIPNIKYVLNQFSPCAPAAVSGLTKKEIFFGIADLTAGAYFKPLYSTPWLKLKRKYHLIFKDLHTDATTHWDAVKIVKV